MEHAADPLHGDFQRIRRDDWVFSTWRSHYHALLHGVDRQWLKERILGGESITIMNAEHHFFSSAIVGGVGPIMTPFFLSHGLRKGRYLATDALCTVGAYITRGIMFRRAGLLTTPLILVGLYIGVVMIAGAWIGRRLIDRMSEKIFLRILEILLVVFGLQFLLWPSR